ncbi:MAG: tRNA uridine-5-carboxymethylaminomethyl(34) synthesis GTPase MnmE [Clostridiales bacterium]|nr:tRNA uridine-5-carboxymethylaminomethyl(34) synthesis GTPase MnmE [Clostridiales bacterium]
MHDDTICALATPRGQGGIAIIRVSGDDALSILKAAFVPNHVSRAFEPNRLMYGRAVDESGDTVDRVMAVYMKAPRSYTREDVAEIHCHGGDVTARRVLRRLCALGARPAAPGEFTKRAFLSGRITLADAEAVMALVGTQSEAAARASVRQLEGGVSGFVRDANSRIMDMLSLIEAGTDFPDEVEEEASAKQVLAGAEALMEELARRARPEAARLMREGASIALAGKPNVGKSSLMNALLEQERAIVTEVPGTTRDTLTERLQLNGIAAEITDTAGQRDTEDPIERMGVQRARDAVRTADIRVFVLDRSRPMDGQDEALLKGLQPGDIVAVNKADLPAAFDFVCGDARIIEVSARTGEGIAALRRALADRLTVEAGDDLMTVERHIALAGNAREALERACEGIREGLPLDLAAIDLKEASRHLSEILGTDATDALIDQIFSRFCVGK